MRARIWSFTLLILLLASVGSAAYLFWRAKQAEPRYQGELTLPGLQAPVQVRFGPKAIPYIQAASQEDLFLAQGYLVAAERMWQMDLLRRLARGQLAEVLGEDLLPVDRLFRTLGLARAAERNLAAIRGDAAEALEAYARGVNAYRVLHASRLPLEYRLAGFQPAPWSPVDSLAIAEYMGFMLSFNFREELAFLRVAARLGTARALELFPSDEGMPAPAYTLELEDYAAGNIGEPLIPYWDAMRALGLPVAGPASNSWAVSGRRTASGEPLLANDPHLAPSMPSIWYELELQAPDFHVAGVALPGLPLVVIGHNEDLAWGFTTAMADTQDIFLERPLSAGTAVERAGSEPEPIAFRTEEIRVRGRQQTDQLVLRSTSNGVIINDILGTQTGIPMEFVDTKLPYLLALRWNIELPDRALEGIYRLNTAQTIEAAREAVRLISHAAQNVLLVHRSGEIAWQMSGALPLRLRGLGTFPVPAWQPGNGWKGYLERDRNPGKSNPDEGLLITANNRVVSADSPIHVSRSWMPPFRAQRIRELLTTRADLAPESLARMQLDLASIEARRTREALHKLEPELRRVDPEAWAVAEHFLLNWDTHLVPESASGALFMLLRMTLFTELFGDELDEDLSALASTTVYTYHAFLEVIRTGDSSFWDDTRTARQEAPAEIWGRALRKARNELARRQGDPQTARLDRLRRLTFPHAFHNSLLGPLFDVGPIGTGGGDHTVNVMKSLLLNPETPSFVPTYRVVFTPGDWRSTRGTQTLGQSGHRFSRYRDDQLHDWLTGKTHPWYWGGPPPHEVIGNLVLVPESKTDKARVTDSR